MKLILKETIGSLGFQGDVVTVKPGYGRNYLLPQGKAVAATERTLRELEENRAVFAAKRAEEQKIAEAIAAKIEGLEVIIEQLASVDERLFGSVTANDICAKLAEMEVKLDKHQVLLNDPLKTLGAIKVTIKVGFNVNAEITVNVVPLQAN
ncbi:50S ribosomal protein L9 [Desulforhopalus vacuolatus]|uniref:50S ribosomal protein L9 n=1 Tax=Desulforhopalus vacuolatus TaxID=40414 RepID=UPI0019662A7B|nr:50S ribosomal protein L9 [Desulforhopalus vacuolatus]MBM9519040.1 50S ribosomal protein L9 [Desulforhopalus vacuolatus]